eukprot:TRINITY_DN9501_c0_g1_i1.p1 TRINITY_DN9501_c0_g1~~TRINITY_DN9501_c0_g1_i1.p1  ORF type:complete len:624 (-),score=149.45 TRINITY_DN9501_c0_g1_i1:22-1836(-)
MRRSPAALGETCMTRLTYVAAAVWRETALQLRGMSGPWPEATRRRVRRNSGSVAQPRLLAFLLLASWVPVLGSAFGPQGLSAEVLKLHSALEESWARISSMTTELQSVGAIPKAGAGGSLIGGGGLGTAAPSQPAASPAGGVAAATAPEKMVPPEKLRRLQETQAAFDSLQQQAFKIGRESADNDELAQHPELNDYVQSLRSMKERVDATLTELSSEYARLTGRTLEQPSKAKKKKGSRQQIMGLSEDSIRADVRKAMAGDSRPFRSRAMDWASLFRERQLQMQDRQRDLQLAMDGPDWPEETWPLTGDDAKHVGEAETMITAALQALNLRLDKLGGLARMHESEDEASLEQVGVLNQMMEKYCDMIERHTTSVQRAYRSRKKEAAAEKKRKKKQKAAANAMPAAAGGGSLRERLLSFGGTGAGTFGAGAPGSQAGFGAAGAAAAAGGSQGSFGGESQPFGWLHDDSAGGEAESRGSGLPPGWQTRNPTAFGARTAGSVPGGGSAPVGPPSSLGTLPPLGSTLGSFASAASGRAPGGGQAGIAGSASSFGGQAGFAGSASSFGTPSFGSAPQAAPMYSGSLGGGLGALPSLGGLGGGFGRTGEL